jgi:hypothetical protein
MESVTFLMADISNKILASRPEALVAFMRSVGQERAPVPCVALAELLAVELGRFVDFAGSGERYSASGTSSSVPLGRALFGPETPVAWLRSIKEQYKRRRLSTTDSDLAAVASAIYYTAVASALCHRGSLISGLEASKLRQALDWMLDQPWIDERCRALAAQAVQRLELGIHG